MKPIRLALVSAILGVIWVGWGCNDVGNPSNHTNGDGTLTAYLKANNAAAVDPVGPAPWDPVWFCPTDPPSSVLEHKRELPMRKSLRQGGVSADDVDLTKDNLGLDSHYVVIKFKKGGEPEVIYSDDARSPDNTINPGYISVAANGEHVSVTVGDFYLNNDILYNVIVTGTTADGSLLVRGGGRKALYLNGADITNPDGPAIRMLAKRTDVLLVGGCERRNKLSGKGYDVPKEGEQAKGTLFAEGSLTFDGTGSLEVRSTDKHAIVSDGFIEMNGGSVFIYESKGDGLHANERIDIKGGILQIKCEGDAIQNERKTAGKDNTPCPITISGGKIKIRTTGVKGHGIVSDSNDVVIGGNDSINISLLGNGSKGIRSRGNVKINGAVIDINAFGARESLSDDTSSAAGIKADGDVEITRGILTIKSEKTNENGKGLNIDGDLKISGGITKISSDGDAVRVRKSITMTGGTLEAKSANKSDIDCDGKLSQTGGTLIADKIKKGS